MDQHTYTPVFFFLSGKYLIQKLVSAGIQCKYVLIGSMYVALKTVTKAIMGTHAILNNGCSYSRVGSALVSMAAADRQIPAIICAETYKFVNKTQVDSFVLNERGNIHSCNMQW
jgi:translation initiation factor eIF-2B subunit delta